MYFPFLASHCKLRRNRVLCHLRGVPGLLSILTARNGRDEIQDLRDETDFSRQVRINERNEQNAYPASVRVGNSM